MTRVLLVLSCLPEDAHRLAAATRRRWPEADLTVILRATHRQVCARELEGAELLDDKPQGSRRDFVRALRRQPFDHGVVAWTGSHSHWPSKLAFALARVRVREVATERGLFAWSLGNIVRHVLWRAKDPVHATAGMPAGLAWPLALPLACLRATVGALVGPLVTLGRALGRRAAR
ncbi:MAG: hypothetical protein R3F56_13780 [Planctomycetota bacterium]